MTNIKGLKTSKKLLLLLGILLLSPIRVQAQNEPLVNQKVNQMSHYRKINSQWIKVNEEWYYQNSKGFFETGWQKIKGKWYYLNQSGAMQTGWKKVKGKWYYLNQSGAMQTGWKKVKGKWYYLNQSGAMQTGWEKVSGNWYYLNQSGAMQTGWEKVSGKWYYLNSSGAMYTGWLTIADKNYYLADSGELLETENIAKLPTTVKELDLVIFNEEFLSLVNRERKQLGRKPLEYDPQLQKGVNIRANEMAAVNEISHIRPNGEAFSSAFKYIYLQPKYYLGENVAYRSVSKKEIKRVEDQKITYEKLYAKNFYKQYEQSLGHYQNMIRKDYKKMTVGISQFENRVFNVMIFSK